jgi:hypothetical protein
MVPKRNRFRWAQRRKAAEAVHKPSAWDRPRNAHSCRLAPPIGFALRGVEWSALFTLGFSTVLLGEKISFETIVFAFLVISTVWVA